jgi:hypothetical protein
MDAETKVLIEVHTRYNATLSIAIYGSFLYCGHLIKNRPPTYTMDLFVELLKLCGFQTPLETSEGIYDFITKNIDNQEKLNLALNRFKFELSKKVLPDLRTSPHFRLFMESWDKLHGKAKFNWTVFYSSDKVKNSRLSPLQNQTIETILSLNSNH